MFAGGAVGTDRGQHAAEQVELVWHEWINIGKILSVGVQLLFHRIVEHKQVFDDGCFLLIQKAQRLGCSRVFLQNAFLDDFVHIGGRQGQPCVKTALDLGKIVALGLGHRVDILLAGHDDPDLAAASGSQVFGNSLQIEHQLGIVADVLADLIHQENQATVAAFTHQVFLDQFGKILDADPVGVIRFFAPIAACRFGHEADFGQCIHDVVLDEVKPVADLCPWLAMVGRKPLFEFVISSLLYQMPLQVGQKRDSAAESLHFVKHLEEDGDNRVFAVFAGHVALRVDIEQDHVRQAIGGKLHVRQHHRVGDLFIFRKVLQGFFAVHFAVGQQVGQDFQEVRFTAAKEAGNPDAHLVGPPIDPFAVAAEEIGEMALQLAGDDIFLQFLADVFVIGLPDLDHALDVPVNRFCKHVLDQHRIRSLVHEPESPVVIIVLDGTEQDQFLSVIASRIKKNDRHPVQRLMKVVQHLVGTKQRIAFADAGQKHYRVLWCVLLNMLDDQAVRIADLEQIAHCFDNPVETVLLLELEAGFHVAFLLQQVNDDVVKVKYDQREAIRAFGVLVLHVGDPLPDLQLLFGRIIEHVVADLVAQPLVLAKGRLFDLLLRDIQALCQVRHLSSSRQADQHGL